MCYLRSLFSFLGRPSVRREREREVGDCKQERPTHSSPVMRGALRECRGAFCRNRKRKNLGASTLIFFFRRSAVLFNTKRLLPAV